VELGILVAFIRYKVSSPLMCEALDLFSDLPFIAVSGKYYLDTINIHLPSVIENFPPLNYKYILSSSYWFCQLSDGEAYD
jgi:hypothetical protein